MSSNTAGRTTPKGGRSTNGRPATFDHLRAKEPLERTVTVVCSAQAAQAWEDASQAVETARLSGATVSTELVEAAERARVGVEEASVTLRFRSIGRKAYDALVEAHPISDETKAKAESDGQPVPPYEPDTFAPALVAASCVEPEMTLDQVLEIWDAWNLAELLDLWAAALEVNTQRRVVSLGKAGYG